MRRTKLNKPKQSMYFRGEGEGKPTFFHSGCTLLDCSLGGGWACGHILNIVGDRSSGKTGLAIEALANFERRFDKGKMYLQEAEANFDVDYACHMGFPDAVEMLEFAETVEEMHVNLEKIATGKDPKLFVLDSLDALSDRRELKRDIKKGQDYGSGKASQMSSMFRKLRGQLKRTNTTLLVISQIRDNIGVMFGEKHKRSGGRAMDFYASQVLWLHEVKKLTKTHRGLERVFGIEVKAKCKKNKVARPFRECTFPYIFEYGIDNAAASRKFLENLKVRVPRNATAEKLAEMAEEEWYEVEDFFTPKKRKYQ